jgi:hypothetical protein
MELENFAILLFFAVSPLKLIGVFIYVFIYYLHSRPESKTHKNLSMNFFSAVLFIHWSQKETVHIGSCNIEHEKSNAKRRKCSKRTIMKMKFSVSCFTQKGKRGKVNKTYKGMKASLLFALIWKCLIFTTEWKFVSSFHK